MSVPQPPRKVGSNFDNIFGNPNANCSLMKPISNGAGSASGQSHNQQVPGRGSGHASAFSPFTAPGTWCADPRGKISITHNRQSAWRIFSSLHVTQATSAATT